MKEQENKKAPAVKPNSKTPSGESDIIASFKKPDGTLLVFRRFKPEQPLNETAKLKLKAIKMGLG